MGGSGGGMSSSNSSISGILFLLRIVGGPMSLEAEEIETHLSSTLIFLAIFIKYSHDKTDDMKVKNKRTNYTS